MESGLDVSIIPNIYDLSPDHTGRLFLEGVSGDMAILTWHFPRAAFWLLDYFYTDASPPGKKGPLPLFLDFDPATLQNALPNLAQIITAVLGIAITVVSIVV